MDEQSGTTGGIVGLFENQQTEYDPESTIPKASINYLIFDEQFKCIGSGFSSVGANSTLKDHHQDLQNIAIPKNGYIYIYCSNESPVDVFFDNLQVTHKRSQILEETHYYPFGLPVAGISSKGLDFGQPDNKKKYQQYEFNPDFGLNLYETFYRSHDPQIGRFCQIDPTPTEFYSLYAAMEDNPIQKIDPFGDRIKVNGSQEDQDAYVAMLNKATGNTYKVDKYGYLVRTNKTLNKKSDKNKSGTLSKEIEKSIASKKTTELNLINSNNEESKTTFVDDYKTGQVDVGDLGKIDDHTLLAAKIGHTITEFSAGPELSKRNHDNYVPNHELGKKTESIIISEMNGQPYSLVKFTPDVRWQKNNPDQIQSFIYIFSYGKLKFQGEVAAGSGNDPSGVIVVNFKKVQ